MSFRPTSVNPMVVSLGYQPISKIHSHTFYQLFKCFPKMYDTTHYHQQPQRRYISSTWPYWRPGWGCTASPIGPLKKLHIKKKVLWIWFQGGLFMKNWLILKKIMTSLIVCACITHQCKSRSKIKNHIMFPLIKCFLKWYDTTCSQCYNALLPCIYMPVACKYRKL